MGAYKQIKTTFESEFKERSDAYKRRIIQWNSEPPVMRVIRPTNIARAREIGYKAKQGIVVVRVRVVGGKKKRQTVAGGRKPSKSGRFFSRAKSVQATAEERAAKKFRNCEVLNSYFVGASGADKFYEVILVDRASPQLANRALYRDILSQRNRAFRGLTHSGRKHRGIATKGYGTWARRPSSRSQIRG